MSVCVSVCSRSSCFSVRWNQQTTGFSGINRLVLSFDKNLPFKSLWRGKANMQMSWSSPSAAFAQFRDQRNAAATWRATGGSNDASEASYWCQPACNKRDTGEGSTRGSEALVRACAVYTQPVYCLYSVPLCVWKVLGTCCSMWDNAWCIWFPPRVLHFSAFIIIAVKTCCKSVSTLFSMASSQHGRPALTTSSAYGKWHQQRQTPM